MSLRTLAPRISAPAALLCTLPLFLAARGCGEPGDPGTCYCPASYAPVCGSDGRTYGNDCEAACADVTITHPGECDTACACPEIYMPVCGSDALTYGNECEAHCAGVMAIHAGPCECPAPPPIWCEWGYATDARGCPSPECLPPPECPPVLCDVYCEHGHALDERGCETCACNPPPPEPTLCWSDDECGAGTYCDVSVCRSPCDDLPPGSDMACPAVCYGECRPIAPPPPPCRADSDCAAGEYCAVPMCIWDDPSAPCPDDGVCLPLVRCGTE